VLGRLPEHLLRGEPEVGQGGQGHEGGAGQQQRTALMICTQVVAVMPPKIT
jgi:hypothetical protein